MTWIGFCEDAALSKKTSGLPCGRSLRIGNSARMRATSASDSDDVVLCAKAIALHLDSDRAVFDFNFVRPDRAHRGQARGPSGHDVEARTVARAFDFASDELTLIERSAVVRALVVDRVNGAVEVA